jgi:hypothetical protein
VTEEKTKVATGLPDRGRIDEAKHSIGGKHFEAAELSWTSCGT